MVPGSYVMTFDMFDLHLHGSLMSAVQIIDDSDLVVSYSTGWAKSGGSNEFNGTTSWTNQPGTTATLVFVGVQVSVVGTIGPRTSGLPAPQSNYTVDGGTPNVYTASQDPSVHYSTKFYMSPILSDTQHTLVVTNLLNSDSFFIDYFLVSKSPSDASFAPTVVTATFTTTATPSSRTSSASAGPSIANTGTIVGSALGAAALVVVAVAFILWLRGRNKRKSDEPISNYRDDQEFMPASIHIQPPGDMLRANQPVHAFASTSDVAQPLGVSPQTQQSGAQDALPPPPRYTLDISQPLIPVRPPSSNGNLSASKLTTLSPTTENTRG